MPCTDVAMHSPALFGRDTGEGETLRVARAIDKDTRTRWPAIHVIQFGGTAIGIRFYTYVETNSRLRDMKRREQLS